MTIPSTDLSSSLSARPRLFLSYSRHDAARLASRLRIDLESRGYDVWVDTRKIRAGHKWEEEVKDGLRMTQVVVAILSPHAVRRSLDPNSPDNIDSVCLDEISFARFSQPPKPIVPVMALSCERPFCIFRLDYVDMTQWSQSEDEYRIGLDRLVQGIQAALRGEPPAYHRWYHLLPSIDFAPFLNEKRQDFVGRKWLFDQIDAWRRASSRERALLLIGDPGIGKSAFVAEMVHCNPGGQVVAYHCCEVDNLDTVRPNAFVASVAAMLAARLPDYADQLDDPRVQQAISDHDPAVAFERGILAPLERLDAPQDGVRYILIDALDEALALPDETPNIVALLAPRVERLPAWLRIVATSRKDVQVLDRLSALRATTIDAQQPQNRADVDAYVSARLRSPDLAERLGVSGVLPEKARETICRAAGGNFLYAKAVLQDLERDRQHFTQLEDLPHGLSGLYRRFFERHFPDRNASYRHTRALMEVLVAALAPLPADVLAEAAELDAEYGLSGELEKVAPFLFEQEGRYTFFHKSLADWLQDEKCAYRASARRGHERLATACWSKFCRGTRTGQYATEFFGTHLYCASAHGNFAVNAQECDIIWRKYNSRWGVGESTPNDLLIRLGDNSYPIMPKHTCYPLEHPVRCVFDSCGRKEISVGVIEQNRSWTDEGVVTYVVPDGIGASGEVELSFNINRDRELRVRVRVPGAGVDDMVPLVRRKHK